MSGVVVEAQDTLREVGYYTENWIPCWNMDVWTIIAQPSEYPKEMYVSDESEEVALYEKDKQTIIAYSDSKHQYVDGNTGTWSYAVDISEQLNEILLEIEELQEQLNEILLKIEELQEQLNELKSKL